MTALQVSIDLKKVPDKEVLEEMLRPDPEQCEADDEDAGHDLSMPRNLHHALWGLGDMPPDDGILDVCWRLTMYLRHWQGGADREWVKNPRLVRARSKKLNWRQCLGHEHSCLQDSSGV